MSLFPKSSSSSSPCVIHSSSSYTSSSPASRTALPHSHTGVCATATMGRSCKIVVLKTFPPFESRRLGEYQTRLALEGEEQQRVSTVKKSYERSPPTREVPPCTPTGERMTRSFTEARYLNSSHPTFGPVQYDTGGLQAELVTNQIQWSQWTSRECAQRWSPAHGTWGKGSRSPSTCFREMN